jgi:hypothetical protein
MFPGIYTSIKGKKRRNFKMKKIINGLAYNTETAKLVASDSSNGRDTYLYKTKKNNYFMHYTTAWQGERSRIIPISKEDAKNEYELLEYYNMDYKEAFDEEEVEA